MDRLDGFWAVCARSSGVAAPRPDRLARMTRSITILGATGSIGRSTAEVVLAHPRRIPGRGGGRRPRCRRRWPRIARSARRPVRGARGRARRRGPEGGACPASGIACGAGERAVIEAVEREADVVVAAISGTAGLRPTHAALKPGRRIALANKESLVCAGAAFMAEARRVGAEIVPVDSEHNALAQALAAGADRGRHRRHDHRHGGAIPHLVAGAHRRGDAGRGRRASGLVHGIEDQHRFRDPDEQGAGADRGAPPLRRSARNGSTCWSTRRRSSTGSCNGATAP